MLVRLKFSEHGGLAIKRGITPDHQLVSNIRKTFNPEEATAKRLVVIRKDDREETKRSPRKRNREHEIIIITLNDNEGQKEATQHGLGPNVLSQRLKKARQGKRAGKVQSRWKDATEDPKAAKD